MAEVLGIDQTPFALIVCTQILIALSLLFFIIYCISEKSVDPHGIIAFIGFHVLWMSAILWYYQLVWIHMNKGLCLVGMIFAGIGTGMALLEHGCYNTVHSWFGMLAFVFGILTLLLGIILTIFVDEVTTDYLYIFLAVLTILLSTIALVTGMFMGYAEYASCFLLVLHVFIVVLYTVGTVAIVLYFLYDSAADGGDPGASGSGPDLPTTTPDNGK